MLKIMIVGATSAIAHETARNFAADGASFYLVARSQPKLDSIAADLQAYGAQQVHCTVLDMNDFEAHPQLLANASDALNGLDVLFMAHGTLGDQHTSQASFDVTMQEFNTNFLSSASM
ncbi:MAG: SDR family NAD(P)-dependent oxidoreductase [Chloroflexota bacterium]